MGLALRHAHRWDLSPREAAGLQARLRPLVLAEDALPAEIRAVAGVDVGFEDRGRITRAAVAVLDFPSLRLIDQSIVRQPTCFPYIPGLLSFRELPALLEALERLNFLPELILVDGHGYAHPRRFGIACHLGVLTEIPTIGVGKTRLVGTHGELAEERGSWIPLIDSDEIVGAVVRTRRGVQPVYVSVGHRLSLSTAVDWVLRCAPRYRLPETTRQAHRLASD
ncbi:MULTISPECIES: deoxyribonuclease V [Methylococcus]|uniref:Endonuclease V n=1 Tax=Methylococcus capsulatus TaxID=414 RepID=A0ABZ2F8N2_METCP|nr:MULTISPECIES: deoxyribonuclease V [Methylococcus]MDF9392598.1 deoxyribonuclease V [Methylococcus capsulatus]